MKSELPVAVCCVTILRTFPERVTLCKSLPVLIRTTSPRRFAVFCSTLVNVCVCVCVCVWTYIAISANWDLHVHVPYLFHTLRLNDVLNIRRKFMILLTKKDKNNTVLHCTSPMIAFIMSLTSFLFLSTYFSYSDRESISVSLSSLLVLLVAEVDGVPFFLLHDNIPFSCNYKGNVTKPLDHTSQY